MYAEHIIESLGEIGIPCGAYEDLPGSTATHATSTPSPTHATRTTHAAAPAVAMVSGGADSMAMLSMALDGALPEGAWGRIDPSSVIVLHINHLLRGRAADSDEELVRAFCRSRSVPFVAVHADIASIARMMAGGSGSGNLEEAGRTVRYAAADALIEAACSQSGADECDALVLTAHNATDRMEGVLMALARGAGVSGLCSIPRMNGRTVRPVLGIPHSGLVSYLEERGIGWHEDETNEDTSYERAFYRHEVIPVMRERSPHVEEAVCRTCDVLADEDAFMSALAAKAYGKAREAAQDGRTPPALAPFASLGRIRMDAGALAGEDVALLRRIIRLAYEDALELAGREAPRGGCGYRKVTECVSATRAGSGSIDVGCGVRFHVANGIAEMSVGADAVACAATIVSGDPVADEDGGSEEGTAGTGEAHGTAWAAVELDVPEGAEVAVSAVSRADRFKPVGMRGKTKRAWEALAERGVPADCRSHVPALRVDGAIAWIPGLPVAEGFRACKGEGRAYRLVI